MEVSVVVPTYYRAGELCDLFESLLKQTSKPLEVIIVDDTPNTTVYELCTLYKDRFKKNGVSLNYVRNPRDRSSAIARNVGAEVAKGDIVTFLDSDVVLFPDYIEKILEVFREHSNALGVQGWIVGLIKRRRRFYSVWFALIQTINRLSYCMYYTRDRCTWNSYPYVLTKTINCEGLLGCNMSIRREVFKEFRFDENLKGYAYMEDFLFSHSIFKKYPKALYITPHAKLIHKEL